MFYPLKYVVACHWMWVPACECCDRCAEHICCRKCCVHSDSNLQICDEPLNNIFRSRVQEFVQETSAYCIHVTQLTVGHKLCDTWRMAHFCKLLPAFYMWWINTSHTHCVEWQNLVPSLWMWVLSESRIIGPHFFRTPNWCWCASHSLMSTPVYSLEICYSLFSTWCLWEKCACDCANSWKDWPLCICCWNVSHFTNVLCEAPRLLMAQFDTFDSGASCKTKNFVLKSYAFSSLNCTCSSSYLRTV
jgi:hypothetical protein